MFKMQRVQEVTGSMKVADRVNIAAVEVFDAYEYYTT